MLFNIKSLITIDNIGKTINVMVIIFIVIIIILMCLVLISNSDKN